MGTMSGTMLVPLDGSALAERALTYAAHLARRTGARLLLVRALQQFADSSEVDDEALGDSGERERFDRLDAASQLGGLAARLRAEGLQVETELQPGNPADVILEAAQTWRADFVAMSTHGRTTLGHWLLGSVADEVVRRSGVPVLLVSGAAQHTWPGDRPLRVLVPLDGSALAESVLGPAGDLAGQLGAELLLVRVVERLPLKARVEAPDSARKLVNDDLAEARRHLDHASTGLRAAGISTAARAIVGSPGSSIASLAREQAVDLIVMATHGRGAVARLALGRGAADTLRRSNVPLLFVRPAALAQPAPRPDATLARPTLPTASVALDLHQLALILRGLGELIYTPGRDPGLAERAWPLLTQLKEIEAALYEGSGARDAGSPVE
jgi:nucleotide-binding universal stress UspA family protein